MLIHMQISAYGLLDHRTGKHRCLLDGRTGKHKSLLYRRTGKHKCLLNDWKTQKFTTQLLHLNAS